MCRSADRDLNFNDEKQTQKWVMSNWIDANIVMATNFDQNQWPLVCQYAASKKELARITLELVGLPHYVEMNSWTLYNWERMNLSTQFISF